jgi:hypothetical protein
MEPSLHFVHDRSPRSAPGRPFALLGLRAKELAILALYIAMVSFAVAHYQQSEDEARAWMLCRSFPLRDLIFHILRYEGHPGLYYLFLWVISKAGFSFTAINWFFAATASAAIYLLLRFSPFPFYLRALIPFGFVLGYQYAVVARSYVLFPLLGFAAIYLYRRVPARPALMALVLALLANVSLHGTMVAIGFGAAYSVQLLHQRREGSLSRGSIVESWLSAGLFASSILFVVFCVWPVQPVKLFSPPTLVKKAAHRLIGPVSYNSLRPPGATGTLLRLTAFTPAPQPGLSAQTGNGPWNYHPTRVYLAFVYPVAPYPALAFLYEGLIALLLLQRRKLILILPFALLVCFLVGVYVRAWHTGLVWVTLLLILWAVWDREVRPTDRNLQNAVAVVLVLLCVLQLRWTFQAILYEKGHASYPARAAASYLKTLPPSERIDGNGIAFGVLPYFSRYLFMDDGPARFNAHVSYPDDVSVPAFIARRLDVILLRTAFVTADDRRDFGNAGYAERHRFCGGAYFPYLPTYQECISAFEKK